MAKIVNLETFFIPDNEKYDILKKEIGQEQTVIGLMLNDGFLFECPGSTIERIIKEHDVYLIPGLACHNFAYDKIIPFDFNLNCVYNSYKDKETHEWNSLSNKFLFLGGVPNRPNRIGLLHRLWKDNLLDQSIYSFFPPWTPEQQDWCRNYIKDDYEKLIVLGNAIDDLYANSKYYGTDPGPNEFSKDPCFIDPTIYSNTLFSIISEGINDNDLTSRYLTEKTYRAFVQKHPFLHASRPEMFDYMKELGFRTFENHMKIQDYAYLPREEDRLDAIVENVKDLIKNNFKSPQQVAEDIDYNYKHFFRLAKDNAKIPNSLIEKFNILPSDIDHWFNKKGFNHTVRVYN